MTQLSVVIPTYNRIDTLQHVLEGFQTQTLSPSDFEVVVVDSSSQDGTDGFMKSFSPSYALRYIRQENKGRPGARNRGIMEARGKIVFFTDSDIIPDNDLLEKHLEFHRTHANAAAVGWESRINTIQELEQAKAHPEQRFLIHSARRKKLSWLYFLTGNASAQRKILLDAGLFDEAFQGYGFEDLELGYRLQKIGIQIHYLSGAVNYHLHPQTFEDKLRTQELAGRNAVRFYRKHSDPKIRLQLGMSPPAFWWHSVLKRSPKLLNLLGERAQAGSKLLQEILIQYHYLSGVKEAW